MMTNTSLAEEKKPVILVFYGGWRSHYNIAYPELQKYNFSATFMPTTENIGVGYDEKGKPFLMNWTMIIEIQNSGHEIGSGGWAFSENFDAFAYPKLIRDIYYSKDRLENHGINIYGFSKNYNITNKKHIDMIKEQYRYS